MTFWKSMPRLRPAYFIVAAVFVAAALGTSIALNRADTGSEEYITPRPASQASNPESVEIPTDTLLDRPIRPSDSRAEPATAASPVEAFEYALMCAKYAQLQASLSVMSSSANDPKIRSSLSPEQLETIEKNLDFLRENEERCRDTEHLLTDGSLYEISLRAARAGSREAANCYILASFNRSENQRNDPVEFEKYRRNALPLLDAGMRAGDWNAASLNVMRYNPGYNGGGTSWLRNLNRPDDEMAYSFTMLKYLGASDPSIALRLEGELNAYSESLTPAAVVTANRRAEEIYKRYFSDGERYTEEEEVCDM